jgi:hypothetical protein
MAKKLGNLKMPLLLPALALKLAAIEDPEALERVRSRLAPRNAAQVRVHTVSRTRGRHAKKPNVVSLRHLRRIARLRGQARAKLPQGKLSKIGTQAATVRWASVKAAVKPA